MAEMKVEVWAVCESHAFHCHFHRCPESRETFVLETCFDLKTDANFLLKRRGTWKFTAAKKETEEGIESKGKDEKKDKCKWKGEEEEKEKEKEKEKKA